jgi:lipid-binding SYLF domain-containing protein
MKTFGVLLIAFTLSLATAGAATEQEIVNQSASILRDFRRMPERGIPGRVIRSARGLAIITVVKVAAKAGRPTQALHDNDNLLYNAALTSARSATCG